jgi:hypothetical protein
MNTAVKLEKQDEGHQHEIGGLREDGSELEREHAEDREKHDQEILCGICEEHKKDTALGCGHQACAICASQLTDCHLCRAPITSRTRLY